MRALSVTALGVTSPFTPAQRKATHVLILGIESSCDDSAAAVLRASDSGWDILSNVVEGQTQLHASFGGVVPEIAARAHAERLDGCVVTALANAKIQLSDLDAIAVTCGPGLIGGVVSGVMLAKGLATATGKPMYGVNHLAGHALTPRLTDNVAFPYLMLLVSGGHCQFLRVEGPMTFVRLGGTIDDAPGEAFDKIARLIGLPQPGGPSVEQAALRGNSTRFDLPRPLLDRPGCDLSFSGLKTALLRARDKVVAEKGGLTKQDQADLAASFQAAVVDVLTQKTARALEQSPGVTALCVAGGVASNGPIRDALNGVADTFIAPPLALCTDNAAMIAWAAYEQMAFREPDDTDLSARPRMPLDRDAAPMLGSGRKGAKA